MIDEEEEGNGLGDGDGTLVGNWVEVLGPSRNIKVYEGRLE